MGTNREEETGVSSFLFPPVHSSSATLAARQGRLRALMEECRLSLLLVTGLKNIFYLTGFRGSAGVAVFGLGEAFLWVDPRYTLEAQEQAQGVEVAEERGNLFKAAGAWLRRQRVRRVGYEPPHLTCAEFEQLAGVTRSGIQFKPAGDLVEALRLVKDQGEVEHIRQAGRVTAQAFEEVLPQVRSGVKESDLGAEIEYRMRRMGAEGAAFETIVASGTRGAFPHARASCKSLGKDELVIFDLGAILNGYAADMTRTVYLGEPKRRVRSLYNAVTEAQERAVEALREGGLAEDVDDAARRVLRHRGVAEYFTHSTGHGVGLDVHEKPRLAKGQKTRLPTGCVVTVEPGIYLKGFGGIRVEDTVLVTPDGPEILTPASKDRWVIT